MESVEIKMNKQNIQGEENFDKFRDNSEGEKDNA